MRNKTGNGSREQGCGIKQEWQIKKQAKRNKNLNGIVDNQLKVAYIVNQYPKVSHSFIRREILALEQQGFAVMRCALRSDTSELVDSEDLQEAAKTHYILDNPMILLWSCLASLFSQPIKFCNAWCLALQLGRRSDRGLLRHLAYFSEACVLNKWCEKGAVDHVHAHFGTNSTMIAMLAHELGGPKYSFTVHGPEEFDKPEFIALGEKIKRADFVVAITSYCRSQLYRLVSSDFWPKINIVHCGLDNKFLAAVDFPEAIEENRFVCVGRLCEQKGQLLLIEAVKRIVDRGLSLTLILAGDGPMRADIEAKIMAYNLQNVVKITGWISSDRVKEELVKAKAMVLPSFAEGLPVVIMESLALATPVITTYIAGIPELVVNGESGWLIPAGSSDEIERAFVAAITLPAQECQRMGLNGRALVRERHDIVNEAGKLASLISGINRVSN